MTKSLETLYAIVQYQDSTVKNVGYNLAEAAHFLLTADSRSYEIRDEGGCKRLFWSRTGNSKPSWTGFFGETESEIFQEIIDGDFDCDGYVAIDQAADSGWWHIASHNDQASYGYGSRSEAEEYAEFLDVGVGPTAVHHIRPISFREAFEMREYLVEGDLGFALDESLVVLREQRAQAA